MTGVSQSADQPLAISTQAKAAEIRNILGAHLPLKKEILIKILNVSRIESLLGGMCIYVSQILAWTDMASLNFICDMLLSVNSPVLYDAHVANEV